MKKILLILMAMLMAVALIACSASGDVESSGDAESSGKNASSTVDSGESDINESANKDVSIETLMKAKESPAKDFEYAIVDGGIALTHYAGNDKMVVIPEKIDGKTVVALDCTFTNNETIQAVKLSDTVIEIGKNTFANCTGLKYFVSGKSLKTIGEYAFNYCTNLEKVVLNEGLERLEFGCLAVEELMNVDVPDSVTFIDWAFYPINNKDRTIIASKGTAAEQYAIDNGCIFKER